MTRIQRLHVSYLLAQIPLGLLFWGAVEALASSGHQPAVRAAYLLFPVLQVLIGLLLPADESDPYKGQVSIAPVMSGAVLLLAVMVATDKHPVTQQVGAAPMCLTLFCLANAFCAVMVGCTRTDGSAAQPAKANGKAPAGSSSVEKLMKLTKERDERRQQILGQKTKAEPMIKAELELLDKEYERQVAAAASS